MASQGENGKALSLSDNIKASISKKSYQKEWEHFFGEHYSFEKLRAEGLKGCLRNSYFRSICWKCYLRCLPEEKELWIDSIKQQRKKYEEIIDKYHVNPRSDIESLDITLNNPLSQSQQSPWNQYFQDAELKLTIQQDVVRTFPEIEFFHTSEVQQMMINILFFYAREFPHISYKQGMHELLAPILFVLHYDQQTYLHASEMDNLNLDIHILLNQNYIEHDAFSLFCQLMEGVEAWYMINTSPFSKSKDMMISLEPFADYLHSSSYNCLGVKLKKICEHLLKQHDSELFSYLEQMEITPQIYGIRWLRLLFGREFSLQDLLIIWDAIFADSISFDLVDYIFVAMLIAIRDLLMQSDYANSLRYLMRYPVINDVLYIIQLARHLRDPKNISKPIGCCVLNYKFLPHQSNNENSYEASKSIINSNNLSGHAKSTLKSTNVSDKVVTTRPNTLRISRTSSLPSSEAPILKPLEDYESEKRKKSASLSEKKNSNLLENDEEFSYSDNKSKDKGISDVLKRKAFYTLPRVSIRNVMENRDHKFKASDFAHNLKPMNETNKVMSAITYKEMVPLIPSQSSNISGLSEFSNKNEWLHYPKEKLTDVEILKEELSHLKSMNEYCAQKITQHLEKLQETMIGQTLQFEDEMFIALAGLKRARDILKGTVSFTEEVINDDAINPYSNISTKYLHASNEVANEINVNLDEFVIVHDEMCSRNLFQASTFPSFTEEERH